MVPKPAMAGTRFPLFHRVTGTPVAELLFWKKKNPDRS
jgi:hypothetical protein